VTASPAAARLGELGQVALPARDLDRAIAFYRDALGLAFLFRAPPGLAFFDCAGVRLMLAAPEPGAGDAADGRAPALYFRTPAIEREAERLRAAGVAFETPPHRIARLPDHDLWMAFFRDPEGNLLALMSEVRSPASVA
jgi:methylmalonyl-CoA/ethylmalonyl-CoA epimerase